MESGRPGHRVRFGPFELDLKAGELCKSGSKVLLSEQPLQILLTLVESCGELVCREEIRQRLWPEGTTVEFDHSINSAVKRLRELLGDNADHPAYIETIPRRGYRFIAPVTDVTNGAVAAPAVAPAWEIGLAAYRPRLEVVVDRTDEGESESAGASLPGVYRLAPAADAEALPVPAESAPIDQADRGAIAVLPFANEGGDPDAEYLSDGITESLINSLSQFGRLRVTARSTVFHYKNRQGDPLDIGCKLNAAAVVTGRVLRRGETLVISAELTDVKRGCQLWGERYKRELTDIFDVQEELARAIFAGLRLTLRPGDDRQLARRPTQNAAAYELYLKGLFFWNKWSAEGFRRAEECFRGAIEEDSAYAPAYAGLADVLSSPRYLGLVPPVSAAQEVRRTVEKALALDESLPLAWWTLGISNLLYDWNWTEAKRAFQRAIEVRPDDARGHVGLGYAAAIQGRLAEGVRLMVQATKLDPLSPLWTYGAGMIYYWMRKDTEARTELRKSLEIEPEFLLSRLIAGQVCATAGRLQEAILEFDQAARDSGGHSYALGHLGYALAASGQRAKANHVLARLQELTTQKYVPPFAIALVHLGAGDKERTFGWLNRAIDDHEPRMTHLNVDPIFNPIRCDPRFAALLSRVGLHDAQRIKSAS